jgi:hypothetical protein
MPYGMGTAVIMAAVGIIILLIRRLIAVRNAVRNISAEGQSTVSTLSLIAVTAAAIGVMAVIYLLPLTIWLLSIVV